MTDHRATGRTLVIGALTSIVLTGGLLGGCGLVPSNRTSTTPTEAPTSPAPAQTTAAPTSAEPTPTAAARSVSADNLIAVDDIYPDDPMTTEIVEAPDGQGRPVSQSYICLPENGLSSLGATSMVTRNFTYKIIDSKNDPYPNSPLKNKPSVYTQALQFPDEAAATAARATYTEWIKNCPSTLSGRGYSVADDQGLPPTTLRHEGGQAQAGMVAYIEPGTQNTDNLYWESAGVTQVKDRLMITIVITWGEDTQGTFDESEGDATFISPQIYLSETSIERLAA